MAVKFRDHAQTQNGQMLNLIQLSRAQPESNTNPIAWEIDKGLTFSPTSGCLVLFTSGTTGLPKGVFLPRQMFHFTEAPPSQEVVYLASCPVHWVGGTGLIDSVLNGENLHMMTAESEPADFWEILRGGKITDMSVSPTLLRRLVEYYHNNIRHLPSEDREAYVNGCQSLKSVFTSGSMLNPSTAQLFTDLAGAVLRNGYGITEMGGGVMATPEGSAISEVRIWPEHPCHVSVLTVMQGYVGRPFPGVTVKLSEGDHGEILVKSPTMFIGLVHFSMLQILLRSSFLLLFADISTMKRQPELVSTTTGSTKREIVLTALARITTLTAGCHATVCFPPHFKEFIRAY